MSQRSYAMSEVINLFLPLAIQELDKTQETDYTSKNCLSCALQSKKIFCIHNLRFTIAVDALLETYLFKGLKVTFVRSFFQRKYKSVKDINGILQFWSVRCDVERDVGRQASFLQSITETKTSKQELTKNTHTKCDHNPSL